MLISHPVTTTVVVVVRPTPDLTTRQSRRGNLAMCAPSFSFKQTPWLRLRCAAPAPFDDADKQHERTYLDVVDVLAFRPGIVECRRNSRTDVEVSG